MVINPMPDQFNRILAICLMLTCAAAGVRSQVRSRLAVLPFIGDEAGVMVGELRALAEGDPTLGIELIDQDLTLAAARGSGLTGNLNLSLGEARALGGSLGADFYLLGKLLTSRRTGEGESYYFETLAGIYLVDGRSGRLLLFQLARAQGDLESESVLRFRERLEPAWPAFSAAMLDEIERRREAVAEPPPPEIDLDDLTGPDERRPVFYQRLKPDYPAEADLAGVTGTVELEAVFRDDGRIDEIRVVRWAGFGLDESSISTLGRLKFKPAERDGKKLTIRGLVRYNFRRPLAQETVSPSQKSEEAERIKRSLQRILTPGRIIRKPPNE